MKKTRIAIIGCGVIAPTHAESYALDKDVELVAACDTKPERARALADKFGFARAVTRAADVFADPGVDAVSICTPHYNHARLCAEALAAGKDVLCEKPVANTFAGLALVRKAAAEHPDRVFAGVFQHRFNPVFRTLRDFVEEGAFGTVLTAAVHNRCLRTADYYNADAWRGTARYENGGVLINQAIHYLDIFQWVMGGVEKVAGAFRANRTHGGVIETEDTLVGAVRFRNGAFGTVEATNSAVLGWDTKLEITGSEGAVCVADGDVTFSRFSNAAHQKRLDKAQRAKEASHVGGVGRTYYGLGHPLQIADFLQCVRRRKAPFVTAADACVAAELVLNLYKAAGPLGR